ncbi:MAG TPA: DinB family protein [Acidimicrobiales bacterium]|nr:DinB family protein [Acidimicrobiales bacterium]
MPGIAPSPEGERELLLAYLEQQRNAIVNAAYGLNDEQGRVASSASTLTVGGLVKHITDVEGFWIGLVRSSEPGAPSPEPDAGRDADGNRDDYMDNFRMRDDETLAGLIESYRTVAAETEKTVLAVGDMSREVPKPEGAPWFPAELTGWPVRWVLLHLIAETARHAGHADIVREGIDGATAYPLMAAVEGWPETPWLKPWTPESD